MNYSKFFAERTKFYKVDLIRDLTNLHLQKPKAIFLAAGAPSEICSPFQNLSITFGDKQRVLSSKQVHAAFQYSASQGYPPLVNKWREFQTHWHNPPFKNWDVAFVTGTQAGLCQTLNLLIDEGAPILAQEPMYVGILTIMHTIRPEFIGIPQDADGIIPENIENICESRIRNNQKLPKALYIDPIGANPTGSVLSNERKHKIYKLAQKYDFLILEDDPYYFVHFLDEQPSSFLSIDIDGRVIRMDSFSKIVGGGLRLGAVTAHRDIIKKLILSIEYTVLHASSLSQNLWEVETSWEEPFLQEKIMAIKEVAIEIYPSFLDSKKYFSKNEKKYIPFQMVIYKLLDDWTQQDFLNHIKKIQSYYKTQRDKTIKCIEKHLAGLAEWTVPKGGMFVWVKLKTVKNVRDLLFEKLIPNDVFIMPGNAFYYDDTLPNQHLRISYSYATEEDVDKGIGILGKILRQELPNGLTRNGALHLK